MIKKTILILGLISISSCSTLNKSVLLGASTGALGGAYIGKLHSKEYKNSTEIGILTGLLFGAAGGYFLYKESEKRNEKIRRETLFNLDKHGIIQDFDFSVPSKKEGIKKE